MAALSQEAKLEQLKKMFEAHNAKFQTTASPQMLYQHFAEDLGLFPNLNITRCVFLGLGRPTRALITPKLGEADTEKQKQFKAAPLTQLVFLTNLLVLLKAKHDINEAFVEVCVDNTIYAATEDSFLRSLSLIPVHSGNGTYISVLCCSGRNVLRVPGAVAGANGLCCTLSTRLAPSIFFSKE